LDLETEAVYFEELLAEVARWHNKNLTVPLSVLSTTSVVSRRNKVQSLVREGIYPEALQADIVDEAAFA
jgi:ABC-type enterochelin transport system ATPase subunit